MLLRNLSEPEVGKLLFDSFKLAINALTIQDSRHYAHRRPDSPARHSPLSHRAVAHTSRRRNRCSTRSSASPTPAVSSCRSRRFSRPRATSLRSRKNYLAVGFKLDYVKADGDLSNYTPDFIVRTTDGTVWIVETKGREEIGSAAEDGCACVNGARMRPPPAPRTTARSIASSSLTRKASSGTRRRRLPDSPPASRSIRC